MSKISDKTGKFLLNYSNVFQCPLFIQRVTYTELKCDASLRLRNWQIMPQVSEVCSIRLNTELDDLKHKTVGISDANCEVIC